MFYPHFTGVIAFVIAVKATALLFYCCKPMFNAKFASEMTMIIEKKKEIMKNTTKKANTLKKMEKKEE